MTEPLTGAMIAAGVKHLRLARNSGCGDGEDGALAAVIYTAMRVASVDTHPKDGDVEQAPLVSGAIAATSGETPNTEGLMDNPQHSLDAVAIMLNELADRCEAATGPDRELDAIIAATLDGYTAIEERPGGWIVATGKGAMERSLGLIDPGKHSRNFTLQHHDTPAYTASLDAAMTLVPEGWDYIIVSDDAVSVYQRRASASGGGYERMHTAGIQPPKGKVALALCAAALRAKVRGSNDTQP